MTKKTNSKLGFDHWNFEFGIYLEFGACYLIFFYKFPTMSNTGLIKANNST